MCAACGGPNPVGASDCLVCGQQRALAAAPRPAVLTRALGTVRGAPARPRAARPQAGHGGGNAGVARAVSWRTENTVWGQSPVTTTVLNFRVDRFDDNGDPLPSLAVEMRGRRFRGNVNDGDWVEVPGSWRLGELNEPRRVRNLTTGTFVQAKGGLRLGCQIAAALLLIVALLVLGLLAWLLFGSWEFTIDSPQPPEIEEPGWPPTEGLRLPGPLP
jgi:hypothetical protein